MKWTIRSFLRGAALALALSLTAGLAVGEELSERERLGLELRVELNRLGTAGDPVEREALLRRLVGECQGTEAAEAAYWELAGLYLDSFTDAREQEAREILELFLKQYPDSRWTAQVKCRLFALYDGKDERAAQLRRELLADKALPQVVRAFLRDGAASPPSVTAPVVQKKPVAVKKTPAKKNTPAKKTSPVKKTTKKGAVSRKR